MGGQALGHHSQWATVLPDISNKPFVLSTTTWEGHPLEEFTGKNQALATGIQLGKNRLSKRKEAGREQEVGIRLITRFPCHP